MLRWIFHVHRNTTSCFQLLLSTRSSLVIFIYTLMKQIGETSLTWASSLTINQCNVDLTLTGPFLSAKKKQNLKLCKPARYKFIMSQWQSPNKPLLSPFKKKCHFTLLSGLKSAVRDVGCACR